MKGGSQVFFPRLIVVTKHTNASLFLVSKACGAHFSFRTTIQPTALKSQYLKKALVKVHYLERLTFELSLSFIDSEKKLMWFIAWTQVIRLLSKLWKLEL